MNPRVLLVDDDSDLLSLVEIYLEQDGFEVWPARSAQDAWPLFERAPDLVVLDLMMPGTDGWTLCSRIRASSAVPILVLTARSTLADKVETFEHGADDYLTKPFEPGELSVRLSALLRRSRQSTVGGGALSDPAVRGELTLLRDSFEVRIQDRLVKLSPMEFRILDRLSEEPLAVVPREDLIRAVWHTNEVHDYLLRIHLRNLRQKLNPDRKGFEFIRTIRGTGYQFLPHGHLP